MAIIMMAISAKTIIITFRIVFLLQDPSGRRFRAVGVVMNRRQGVVDVHRADALTLDTFAFSCWDSGLRQSQTWTSKADNWPEAPTTAS